MMSKYQYHHHNGKHCVVRLSRTGVCYWRQRIAEFDFKSDAVEECARLNENYQQFLDVCAEIDFYPD